MPDREALRQLAERMRATADRLKDHAMSPDLSSLEAGAHARAGAIVGNYAKDLLALVDAEDVGGAWQDMASAPKGSWLGGLKDTRHPDYVRPPHLWLLLEDGQRCVGSADAYYAEGGRGYDGDSFWVEEFSGERVRPIKWQHLPASERTSR